MQHSLRCMLRARRILTKWRGCIQLKAAHALAGRGNTSTAKESRRRWLPANRTRHRLAKGVQLTGRPNSSARRSSICSLQSAWKSRTCCWGWPLASARATGLAPPRLPRRRECRAPPSSGRGMRLRIRETGPSFGVSIAPQDLCAATCSKVVQPLWGNTLLAKHTACKGPALHSGSPNGGKGTCLARCPLLGVAVQRLAGVDPAELLRARLN